jgi:hypothetical protein
MELITNQVEIENKIYTLRGVQIMLDTDLAILFNVETKNLNKAAKRNEERFPNNYRFQLTENEWDNLRFQFGTSSEVHGGRRYIYRTRSRYAFSSFEEYVVKTKKE